MPWTCKCGRTIELDTITACPACGGPKGAWSLFAARTRQFVVKSKRFELLRGVEPQALPAGSEGLRELETTEAQRLRAVPHAQLRAWKDEGRVPPPSHLLFVRLHHQKFKDLTVTVGVKPTDGEVREVSVTPGEVGPETADVAVVLAFGPGPPVPADAFPGLTVVDVGDGSATGHAPELEVTALRRAAQRLLVVSHDPDGPTGAAPPPAKPRLELVGLDLDGNPVAPDVTLVVRGSARYRAKVQGEHGTYRWKTSTPARLRIVGPNVRGTIEGPEVRVEGLTASAAGLDAKLEVTFTSDTTGETRSLELAITVLEAVELFFAPFPGSTLRGRAHELLRGPLDVLEDGKRQPMASLASGAFALRPGAVLLALEAEYAAEPQAAEPTAEQALALLGYRVHRDAVQNILRFQYDHGLPTTARLDGRTTEALRARLKELP